MRDLRAADADTLHIVITYLDLVDSEGVNRSDKAVLASRASRYSKNGPVNRFLD